MKRLLTRLGIVAALMIPAAAHAEQPPVTVAVEPGVAAPLTKPQSDRFGVGGDATLRPLFHLTPYLALNPSIGYLALPSRIDGIDTGTALALGGGARLHMPHDESNKGSGFSAVAPWVAADGQYIRTDGLDRFGYLLTAGAAVPTSAERTVWVGPFVGFQGILQTEKAGFNTNDARVGILGVSVEFGPSPVKRAEPQPPPQKKPEPPKVEKPKEEPKPQPPPADEVVILEGQAVLQFNVDSAVILPPAKADLDKVVKLLKENSNFSVEIAGHASSEGPPEPYNQKLSERRAQAVLDFLKAAGLPADRMTAKGYSYSKPVASNKTEAGRRANRRVEVTVDIVVVRKGDSK